MILLLCLAVLALYVAAQLTRWATGDHRPIFWLIEKFMRDPESTRTAAIRQLAQILPVVQALIEQSGPWERRSAAQGRG